MRSLCYTVTISIAVGLLVLCGCSGGTATGPDEHTPVFTGTMLPADNSEQLGSVALQWSCTDPDGDPITYSVYMGENRQPPLVARGLTTPRYAVSNLERGKRYYWQIVAKDSTGRMNISPLRQFSTVDRWSYPLKPGTYWIYDGISYFTSFSFTEGSNQYTDTMNFHSEVSVDGTDLVGDIHTYRLHENYWDHIGRVFTSDVWVGNSNDGLYSYASEGSSQMVPFKRAPGLTFKFRGKSYDSIESLMADLGVFSFTRQAAQWYTYDPPVRTLAYPLEVGEAWISNQSNDDFRIDKVVTDSRTYTTPAGDFSAFEIQRLWSWLNQQPLLAPGPGGGGSTQSDEPGSLVYDDNLVLFDYISDIGMVGRRWEIKNIEIIDYSGSSLGFADVHEQWWLTDFGAHERQ